MPTVWWLRPVNSADRVGEHNAVVVEAIELQAVAASRSATGVAATGRRTRWTPRSRRRRAHDHHVRRIRGGRSGLIGAKFAAGSLASYVIRPSYG